MKVSAVVTRDSRVVVATRASGAGNAIEGRGQLSAKAPDATHVPFFGARFVRSASAQGIAVVRVNTAMITG